MWRTYLSPFVAWIAFLSAIAVYDVWRATHRQYTLTQSERALSRRFAWFKWALAAGLTYLWWHFLP